MDELSIPRNTVLELGVQAPRLEISAVRRGRYFTVSATFADERHPCLDVVLPIRRSSQIALAHEQDAVWELQGLVKLFLNREHLLVSGCALVGMRELVEFDFAELMHPVEPLAFTTPAAGFRPEAMADSGDLDRKIFLRNHGLGQIATDRDLGGADETQISFRKRVNLASGSSRREPGSGDDLVTSEFRRRYQCKAMLDRQVQREADEAKFEKNSFVLQEVELRTGDFRRRLKIQDVQLLAELDMIERLKAELGGLTHMLDGYVAVLILAGGNVGSDKIGNLEHFLGVLLFDDSNLFLECCHGPLETSDFGLELFASRFVSTLELPGDLVGSMLRLFEGLPLPLQLPIQGNCLVDVGIGVTIKRVLPDHIDVVENKSNV